MKTLNYRDIQTRTFTIDASRFGEVNKMELNNLVNPTPGELVNPIAIPGILPFLYLYQKVRVLACKVTCSFYTSGNRDLTCFIAWTQNRETDAGGLAVYQSWEQWQNRLVGNPRYCRYKTLRGNNANQKSRVTMSKYFGFKNLLGLSPGNWSTDEAYSSEIPNNTITMPEKIVLGYFGILLDTNTVQATDVVVTVQTKYKFYVKFYDKILAGTYETPL